MTTTGAESAASSSARATAATEETPWYELISDVPEPPEDAMQQEETILEVMSILKARYDDVPGALWCSQSNVIYDSAVPGSVLAPDGCVVFGLETNARDIKRARRSYRIDEWGAAPAFVLEVGSPSTANRDLGEKREIYARIGVQEYWRLDRYGESYPEPLLGERLVDGEYVPLELHTEPNGDVWSRSETLGLDFFCRVEDGEASFFLRDSTTGEWLNTLGDEIAAHAQTRAARYDAESQARQAQEQAREARAQAQAAEERNRELQTELERLRRQLDRQ